MALRVGDWKLHFAEQRNHGITVWEEPLVTLRIPKLFNLKSDPFERSSEDAEMFYSKWKIDRVFLLIPAQDLVAEFLKTFQEFPPRAKSASFSIDQAMEKLMPKEVGMEPAKKEKPAEIALEQ